MALPIFAVLRDKNICQKIRHTVKNLKESLTALLRFFSAFGGQRREKKSSVVELGNRPKSRRWGCGKVSITGAPPLSVLLGWAVSRGEHTSCCITDEEDVQ